MKWYIDGNENDFKTLREAKEHLTFYTERELHAMNGSQIYSSKEGEGGYPESSYEIEVTGAHTFKLHRVY